MSARSRHRGNLNRARVIPALAFLCVWVLGFEIVPVAHQAMHAQMGAHTHGAAATHCHGALCHSDDGADRERRPKSDPSHGAGSLEHRAVAALTPELTIHVPELVLAGELPADVVLEARTISFERCSPPATGPPV